MFVLYCTSCRNTLTPLKEREGRKNKVNVKKKKNFKQDLKGYFFSHLLKTWNPSLKHFLIGVLHAAGFKICTAFINELTQQNRDDKSGLDSAGL